MAWAGEAAGSDFPAAADSAEDIRAAVEDIRAVVEAIQVEVAVTRKVAATIRVDPAAEVTVTHRSTNR